MPRLFFIADSAGVADPLKIIADLPPMSGIIIRDYNHPNREKLCGDLIGCAKAKGHKTLIAGDPAMARRLSADGLHLPEFMLYQNPLNYHGFKLVTASCHTIHALKRAHSLKVNAALISPIFKTRSHPDAHPLGHHQLARLLSRAPTLNTIALGGINPRTSKKLAKLPLYGVAMLSGFKKSS